MKRYLILFSLTLVASLITDVAWAAAPPPINAGNAITTISAGSTTVVTTTGSVALSTAQYTIGGSTPTITPYAGDAPILSTVFRVYNNITVELSPAAKGNVNDKF